MSAPPETLVRRSRVGTALAAALLSIGTFTAVQGATPASAATCPINVASYGHTLAAAQQALKAVSSTCRTIVFPAGTYSFNGQFRIAVGNVTVSGQPGAVIQPTSGTSFSGGLVQVHAAGVTVTGLTITGSRDKGIEVSGSTNFTISKNIIHDNHKMGIHVLRSSGGVLSGNTVYRNTNNGIDLHGATNVTISGNKSYLNGGPRFPETLEGQGIIVYCSQNVKILSNTVWNNSQYQAGTRNGIHISDNNQQNGEMATRYITIDGNRAYDDQSKSTQGYAIRIGGYSSKVGDINFVTITNNTGYGNIKAGIFTKGLAPGATVKIDNNTLTGGG